MANCLICEKIIPPYKGHHPKASKERRTCSKSCAMKLALQEGRWHLPNPPNSYGETNTNWKGGKKITKAGYVYVLAPADHPKRGSVNGKRRYIAEHRLVMEKKLGRILEDWEKVHHRNGVKNTNEPENLEIVTHVRHRGEIICPYCLKPFHLH